MTVRRLYALLLSVLLLGVAGCSSSHPDNTVSPVTAGFTCHTAMQYHELALEADMTRDTAGKLTLTFTAPNTLEGVAIGWDGKDMTMELGGMSVAVPADRVPQGALVQQLLCILATDHGDGTVTEEGYTVQGDLAGSPYTLVCHPDIGFPQRLSYPAEELQVTFTDARTI